MGKLSIVGKFLEPILQKIGLGINDCSTIRNGGCVCLGKGLYMGSVGGGLFIGPQGNGLFLGRER